MKKIIILFIMILSTVSYSQTAITDGNFQTAINTCLSTNPADGLCLNIIIINCTIKLIWFNFLIPPEIY